MTDAQQEELDRLTTCHQRINDNLKVIGARLAAYAKEVQETKTYMWEARRDLDHIDKVAVRQTIDQKIRSADVLREQQQKLLKLRRSPYFGRFDFLRDDTRTEKPAAIYVGVHDLRDEQTSEIMVHDWRAPISSMFYDYEIGPAGYEAPTGEIRGRLDLKRQFRIRDGEMELMLESGVNIVDDVLQEELGRASDDSMKNIVATIQRDQNAIIRNASDHTLIIQGVAGSGKTSIALHRIAFLLYRFKDTLTAEDILIISPNKVFADYIGNVLPELGEENVSEIQMETLADELLDGKVRFQTFFEQTERLLDHRDEHLAERVAFKASPDLIGQIESYADHLDATTFAPQDWRTGAKIVPAWHFEETWRKYRGLPVAERMKYVYEKTEHQFFIHYRRDLEKEERQDLRRSIRAMVKRSTLRAAYKDFFTWLERPDLFKAAGGRLEYADVFPLIYLKMRIEGVAISRSKVKHLLVDEMQDYTPVQYAVLGKLFQCRKTILGDITQSVNPSSASAAESIRRILKATPPMTLTKSYRSTWEIMQFALGICPNAALQPMRRHGETPVLTACTTGQACASGIVAEIERFAASPHRTLAIIARTQKQANKLHRQLAESGADVRLLDPGSGSFSSGVVVCTPHLAKGLEFDHVILADVSDKNYRNTAADRGLLYIACTRAMHRLMVFYTGEPSPLLAGVALEPASKAAT